MDKHAVVDGRGTLTVFEIYIKTTPERLWEAITDPEMRAKYTFGVQTNSDWKPGSGYESSVPGVVDIAAGENLEVDPPRRLVQSFNALWSDEVRAAPTSRVTWEIEPVGDSCQLTVTHDQLPDGANSGALGRLDDDPLGAQDAARDGGDAGHARLAALLRRGGVGRLTPDRPEASPRFGGASGPGGVDLPQSPHSVRQIRLVALQLAVD